MGKGFDDALHASAGVKSALTVSVTNADRGQEPAECVVGARARSLDALHPATAAVPRRHSDPQAPTPPVAVPGSPKSRRPRSRSRTDSNLRRQRQRQAEVEASGSTILLVSNLVPGAHGLLIPTITGVMGKGSIKDSSLDPQYSFGFVEFASLSLMAAGLKHINGLRLNGTELSAERCQSITPGQNPRSLCDLGEPTWVAPGAWRLHTMCTAQVLLLVGGSVRRFRCSRCSRCSPYPLHPPLQL